MAYEIPGLSFTLVSAADLTNSQFRFVDVDATGKAVLPGAGGPVVGVCNNHADVNEPVTVVSNGISKVEAGGAIPAGSPVGTDATGRAVVAAAGAGHGRALETASGAGIRIAVLLLPTA